MYWGWLVAWEGGLSVRQLSHVCAPPWVQACPLCHDPCCRLITARPVWWACYKCPVAAATAVVSAAHGFRLGAAWGSREQDKPWTGPAGSQVKA